MQKVRLEETENRRRLHIRSYFVDLNESDYQELTKIFSLSPVGEVTESRIKEMAKEHAEMLKMTNWDSLGDVFKQAEIGFEYGFKECLEMMRSQALSSTEWVSVEDRLPEQQAGFFICLGFTSSGHETLKLAFNCKTKRFQTMNFEDIHKLITHWMPLPNPPKSHE